jgi:hypothetical protein
LCTLELAGLGKDESHHLIENKGEVNSSRYLAENKRPKEMSFEA